MQLVHSALKSKYSANCREKKMILAYLVSSHYLYCTILQFLEHCVYISDQKSNFFRIMRLHNYGNFFLGILCTY